MNRRTTIDGAGHKVTISGGGAVQLFAVEPSAELSVRALTVANGVAQGSGGGIFNFGTLRVFDSTFTGHRATATGGAPTANGGAIFSLGTLEVVNSTFAGNSAEVVGGAIANQGTASIVNSTFANNAVGQSGAAIITSGTLTLRNNVFADRSPGGNCVSFSGTIVDSGGNIATDESCTFTQSTSLSNTDPLLDPAGLKDNGDPTQTIALCTAANAPAGCSGPSPAIDFAANCPAADQRGMPRGGDGIAGCDSGAYEFFVPPAGKRYCSILGDDRPPSKLDQDVYHFRGMKGEDVALSLDEFAGAMNSGKQASLVLIDAIKGVYFVRHDGGDLPNRIVAKLPASGWYYVAVAEHPKSRHGMPFRGNYCVTLESSMQASGSFEPTQTVESQLNH